MSAKYWKLVITPISTASAAAAAREALVEGDNWLSALRAARKALGEDGAVPTGASCVMSATGEVTILDSAKRLRYVLSRSETPGAPEAPAPASSAEPRKQANKPPSVRPPANPLPPPAVSVGSPRRSATVAYSPEESAAIRAQTLGLPGPSEESPPPASAGEAGPKPQGFAPARPLSRPPGPDGEAQRGDPRRPIPAKRSATVGYTPPEPGATSPALTPAPAPEAATEGVPRTTEAATVGVPPTTDENARVASAVTGLPPPAGAALPPPAPVADSEASPPKVAPLGGLPVPPLDAVSGGRPPGRPGRKQTMTYSAEESATIRAQAGFSAPAVRTTISHVSSAQDHLVQSEVPSMMVTLGHRDEEPSAESPLSYRERSYFWQPPAQRDEVERALRAELLTLRQTLAGRPRGQYINLAVFDHAFEDKPLKAPVATLQWKDWRGEPAFAWLADQAGTGWRAPQPGEPVASSYFPGAPSTPPPAVASAAPPAAPTARSDRVTQPTRRPPSVPDNQQVKRESTGEQDLRLAVAFEATQDLYFLSTPADGLDFAVKLLRELVPAEAVSGCIYDINTNEFRFVAVSGTGATERRAAAVRGNLGLFAVAAHSGLDNLVIPDIANEPRYDAETDGRMGLLASNMAFFVLHRGGQLFGMLQIINREGPKGFREGDIAVGGYIANQVTSFLREKRGLRA